MNSTTVLPARVRIDSLRGRVVVITGASSGIGRATAQAFARRGAKLALAARDRDTLEDVAAECEALGAQTLVVPVDVGDDLDLQELATATVDAFGGIDVWINNAGVGLFGPFTSAGMEFHRQVVETNLLGGMNGAAAALPVFQRQGRGVLITNISLGGFAPVPFATAYTASKFGLRGFMAALRQELADMPGIRVCSIFPSIIDSPGLHHGANVSNVALKAAPPVYSPRQVAEALVGIALRPRDEVPLGLPAYAAKVGYGLMPALTERALGGFFRRYLKHGERRPHQEGNLFRPSAPPRTVVGGWRRPTPAPQATALAWAGGAGLAIAGLSWLLRRAGGTEVQ